MATKTPSMDLIEFEAMMMAEAINGGTWNKHYTEAQKAGWRLMVLYAMKRYGRAST